MACGFSIIRSRVSMLMSLSNAASRKLGKARNSSDRQHSENMAGRRNDTWSASAVVPVHSSQTDLKSRRSRMRPSYRAPDSREEPASMTERRATRRRAIIEGLTFPSTYLCTCVLLYLFSLSRISVDERVCRVCCKHTFVPERCLLAH